MLLFSCNNESSEETLSNFDTSNFSTKQFVGNIVGFQDGEDVKLGIKEENIIKSFNNYNKSLNQDLVAVSILIEKIEDNDYIRFYNEDGSVSTVALLEANVNNLSDTTRYAMGGTVCTTSSCASCCGCVPDGNYCTPCEYNTSDCSRKTSG